MVNYYMKGKREKIFSPSFLIRRTKRMNKILYVLVNFCYVCYILPFLQLLLVDMK